MPIFLVGCEYPIHGTLQVNSALTLKDHRKHSFELAPGNHYMEVKRDENGGKLQLKMKVLDKSGKKRKVKLHLPDPFSIPDYSGNFAFDSAQIGQSFDLVGSVDTIETDSTPQVNTEPCGYGYGYYYDYYYEGTRLITSHRHDKVTHVGANFKSPDADETVALYSGSITQSHKVIDSVGTCFLNHD